ncbi:MAG: hypothetical protein ACRC8Q_09565 [Aeromonas sp.]
MKWQIKYTLENIKEETNAISAEHVGGDAVNISFREQPDVLAVISDSYRVNEEQARNYHAEFPNLDFLCGYRKECIWEGGAISYLENNGIGWGSAGTLYSAVYSGNVNIASHKDYSFAVRIINQLRVVKNVGREFDRILSVTLVNGRHFRIGMVREYEPTADAIRTIWDICGPIDIAWNINPNGNPTLNAIDAGLELGCKVMKWEELKAFLQSP